VREADNLTTFTCRMSWKSGSLNLLEPSGPHRACYGTALPFKCTVLAGPGGRAVYGVDLRPLACWDSGFEYLRKYECLCLVSVVCWQLAVSATGRSLVQSPTESVACLNECDYVTSTIRTPVPIWVCRATRRKNIVCSANADNHSNRLNCVQSSIFSRDALPPSVISE
jgi:hypothetical protein